MQLYDHLAEQANDLRNDKMKHAKNKKISEKQRKRDRSKRRKRSTAMKEKKVRFSKKTVIIPPENESKKGRKIERIGKL